MEYEPKEPVSTHYKVDTPLFKGEEYTNLDKAKADAQIFCAEEEAGSVTVYEHKVFVGKYDYYEEVEAVAEYYYNEDEQKVMEA